MPDTLVHLLSQKAKITPDQTLFHFLQSGFVTGKITFIDLDRRARSLAIRILKSVQRGQPVLILHPPGRDFIIGFFGCLYAGVVPVPAYPPNQNKLETDFPKLLRILQAGNINHILTTSKMKELLKTHLSGILFEDIQFELTDFVERARNIKWITSDRLRRKDSKQWAFPDIKSDDIAFIQYTSGSTTDPKGVLLNHNNILHNLELISRGFGCRENELGFSWLPPYHDMGLIGGILTSLYASLQTYLTSPLDFARAPLSWMNLISQKRVNISGGPNFAYELCIKRMKQQQGMVNLDLSSWRVAFVGAEPIDPETIMEFGEIFSKYGFNPDSFYPCYGLAESTLFACGGVPSTGAVIRSFDINESTAIPVFKAGQGKKYVSCGNLSLIKNIKILGDNGNFWEIEGKLGEICVSGESVCKGYFNQSQTTKHAFIESIDRTKYFKTGDIGFVHEMQLFVTGRKKELMVIRGKNYFPADIERTVQKCDSKLRRGPVAVFTIGEYGDTRLVVLQEIGKRNINKRDSDDLMKKIRSSVYSEHEIRVDEIMLLRPNSIPKTTSGKIRRIECKNIFSDRRFEPLSETGRTIQRVLVEQKKKLIEQLSTRREAIIKQIHRSNADGTTNRSTELLHEYLGILIMEVLEHKLSINFEKDTLSELGIDSIAFVQMYFRIEKDLKIMFEESDFDDKLPLGLIEKNIIGKFDVVSKVDVKRKIDNKSSGHNLVSGDIVPLLPSHERFFETYPGNPNRYNIFLYVSCPPIMDTNKLEASLREIISEHSVFSMRFKKKGQNWYQYFHDINKSLVFDSVSRPPKESQKEFAKNNFEQMSELIDVENGPVIVARHFKAAPFGMGLLQIMLNHLFSDYFSCYILLNELEKRVYSVKGKISNESNSINNEDSYIKWALKYGSEYPDNSLNMKNGGSTAPVRKEKNTHKDLELDREETMDLYEKYPKEKDRHNLFLAILFQSLEAIGDSFQGYIELKHHWRTNSDHHIDLRKTIGWIATPFFVKPDFQNHSTAQQKFDYLNEYLESMKHEDKLKELLQINQKIKNGDRLDAKIKFTYQGRFDDYSSFGLRSKNVGGILDTGLFHTPYYRILLHAGRIDNKEAFHFCFDLDKISEESIELFLQNYEQSLKNSIS